MRSVLCLSILLFVILGGAQTAQSAPRNPPRLASEVAGHLGEASTLHLYKAPASNLTGPWLSRTQQSRPDHEVRVWVFMTDKGIGTQASFQTALHQVERSWNKATRRRRSNLSGGGRPAFTDIPVYEPYVAALQAEGFSVHRQSRWLNAVSLRVPAGQVQRLALFPFVRFVQPVLVSIGERKPVVAGSPKHPLRAAGIDSAMEVSFYGASYQQLEQIQVLDLHRAGYTGAGVKVMILDTGFKSSHPVFGTCTDLQAQHDYVFNDGNTENEPADNPSQHNHGTGVWGTLGGYAPGNLIGPAWAAQFYLAKTEDVVNEVHAEEDNYVAALEWADTLGVDVTSASLAYLTFDDSTAYSYGDLNGDTAVITVAIDIAAGKGLCCVNAMGNFGPGVGSLWTPADADSVIACGAVNSSGVVASFSSRGPTSDGRTKPEISARGVSTAWAVATTNGYGTASGTSLSTPLIGGLAALIKEARPAWTGADIRTALMLTGTNNATPDNDIGWGIAQGLDAANHGGGSLSPPRMTLPFALGNPPDSAVVLTVTPELVWGTSTAMQPGDAGQYTVHYHVGAASPELTAPAGADTSWTVAPTTLAAGDTLFWWVSAVGDSGYVRKSMDRRTLVVSTLVATGDEPAGVLELRSPFPNPFRGSAHLRWQLEQGETVRFTVYDLQGRTVWQTAARGFGGWTSVTWDGHNLRGSPAPPGVYWLRAQSPHQTLSRKLIKLP